MSQGTPTGRRATVVDVAKRAGVSTATVSRVLSGSAYPVSAQARSRIERAARELNYTPNMIGRMLKKSTSRDIGVIIPNISNPFYTELVLGIETQANRQGYNLLLCNSLRSPAAEYKYIQTLYQKQVAGIILSTVSDNSALLGALKRRGVQILALDQSIDAISCGRIDFEHELGARMAIDYLIALGHRRIALVSSPLTVSSRKEQLSGYRKALEVHGIPFDESLLLISSDEREVSHGGYEFENGRARAEDLLAIDPLPTAVFAGNDMTAIGLLQGLQSKAVRVPHDISIIGYDNIAVSRMVTPSLSTVDQSAYDAGCKASELLIGAIEQAQAHAEPQAVIARIPPQIIERESTAPPGI